MNYIPPKLTWKPLYSLFRGTVVFIGPFLDSLFSFREKLSEDKALVGFLAG